MIDYNRCGVPLIEIVTEPDIRSAEVGRKFFEKLKGILEFVGVSDCRMQEGSLRCDVNLSLHKKYAKEFGARSEMKNLNSFKAVYNSMIYESKRQAEILDEGGKVIQETRRWDDVKNISISSAYHTHIDIDSFVSTDTLDVLLFQSTQKL